MCGRVHREVPMKNRHTNTVLLGVTFLLWPPKSMQAEHPSLAPLCWLSPDVTAVMLIVRQSHWAVVHCGTLVASFQDMDDLLPSRGPMWTAHWQETAFS